MELRPSGSPGYRCDFRDCELLAGLEAAPSRAESSVPWPLLFEATDDETRLPRREYTFRTLFRTPFDIRLAGSHPFYWPIMRLANIKQECRSRNVLVLYVGDYEPAGVVIDAKLEEDQLGHGIGVNLDTYTIADLEQRLEAVNLLEKSLTFTAIN